MPSRHRRGSPAPCPAKTAAGGRAAGRCTATPARRAARRDRPVRDRDSRAERGNPPLRRRDARRSPVLKTRHHRFQLRTGRLQPADHPRPRRQPSRHRRERYRRRRRLRPRRGSFRADRSAGDQSGRSRARPGRLALRLDLDRRRRQRHQQPHSGGAALLPGGAVPELRPAGQGAAGGCAIRIMRDRRDAHGRQFGRSRRRRRYPARCRRRQFCRPRRRLWPQGRRLQHPRLSLSVRPDAARERKATELGRTSRRRFGRRFLHLPRRLHRRCDHAERFALPHPRHRRRRSPDPDRRAPDQVFGQGRIPAGRGGDRCRQVLGERHRLQAQRDRSRRSRRPLVIRRAADLYQQGAGRPRRGADDAVQRTLCRRHHRLRPAGQPSATDGAEPGRSGQPAQRFVGPEQEHQGRRLRLQRIQVQRDARRHRSPAVSSMSASAERRRRSFRSCSTSTPIPAISVRRSRAI